MEKLNNKRELIFFPLLTIPFIYIGYVWTELPDRIAIHFNLHGIANGWSGKWGIFIIPCVNIAIYLLILFLPLIDPKRMNADNFTAMFYKIRILIVTFMFFMSLLAIDSAVKGSMSESISHWIPVGVFLFLSVFGNFMINIKPNWFIGIRTPWTLSSDTVWRRTHQVMGRTWFYGGLLCAALSCLTPDHWTERLIIAFAAGTALFAFVYSFWLYKKEKTGTAV